MLIKGGRAPPFIFSFALKRAVRAGRRKMADIPSHHLIYGSTVDFVTGERVVDTDDERYRQKLARLLVEKKGYDKKDLEMRLKIETLYSGQFVVSTIDITVRVEGRRLMVIRYGPGSLVTRERPAIAAARVLDKSYRIPLAVVTNGEDAELIDTLTGKVIGQGLDSIPAAGPARAMAVDLEFSPFADAGKRDRELRILNAFDLEVCCVGQPCALPGAPEG